MSKLSDLSSILYKRTIEKKLKWDIIDDDAISVVIGQNGIQLSKHILDDDYYYLVEVKNVNGVTVDEERFFENEAIYEPLADLLIRARRDALRADETLDDIMNRLDKL